MKFLTGRGYNAPPHHNRATVGLKGALCAPDPEAQLSLRGKVKKGGNVMRVRNEEGFAIRKQIMEGSMEELWEKIVKNEGQELFVHTLPQREEIYVKVIYVTSLEEPGGAPEEWWTEVHIYAPPEKVYHVRVQEFPVHIDAYHIADDFLDEETMGFLVIDHWYYLLPARAVHQIAWAVGRRTPWFARRDWTWELEEEEKEIFGEPNEKAWGCAH